MLIWMKRRIPHRPHIRNHRPDINLRTKPDYFARSHTSRSLPSQAELAARIQEADGSARLLLQMVDSTPGGQFASNELLIEFANRCQRASNSLQLYMQSTDPVPDDDTMFTLIETNDKISLAISKYQRAALSARKEAGSRDPFQTGAIAQSPPQAQAQAQPLTQAVAETPNMKQVSPIDSGGSPQTPSVGITRKALGRFRFGRSERKSSRDAEDPIFEGGNERDEANRNRNRPVSPVSERESPQFPSIPGGTNGFGGSHPTITEAGVDNPFADPYFSQGRNPEKSA